jgi:DNA helicase-2/ATP-dependent DNA helicase PcrA
MEKLKIVIAGAGSGKTHNLKEDVLQSLPSLEPCYFCAVITFTNAATEELRNRISKSIKIQPNLFIGTIHSFFVQFVLEPYGKLLNLLPEDKMFVDGIKTFGNSDAQKKYRIDKANELEKRGLLVYDKILEISEKILENEQIFNLFTNRLKYLFIDEYQDVRIRTHKIWERIIESNRVNIYIIGDPLQHIFGFTYDTTHLDPEEKIDEFSQTPLKSLSIKYTANVECIKDNWRSNNSIVELTNNYILDNQFKQIHHANSDIPVYFIKSNSPEIILEKYFELKLLHNIAEIHKEKLQKSPKPFHEDLFITRNWIDASWAKGNLPIFYKKILPIASHLSKGESIQTSKIQEITRNILAIAKLKKSDFIKDIHDELKFRIMCFDLINQFKDKDYSQIKELVKNAFNLNFNITIDFSNGEFNQENSLNCLLAENQKKQNSSFSTVFSSKGLEASSVLVIATDNQELTDWLDFEKANNELDDKYRLGYVAFSRAREMLCIASFGKISDDLYNKINNLNLKIIA